MPWTFQKEIKAIPDICLTLTQKGISTEIATGEKYNPTNYKPLPENYYDQPSPWLDNIFSVDIVKITTQGMQGIKEAILLARTQRKDLTNDLANIEQSLRSSKFKLKLSYAFLYGLIKRSISDKIKTDISAKKDTIERITAEISKSKIDLKVIFDQNIRAKYDDMISSFKKMAGSQKIWDVTSENYQDRVKMRSAASTVVQKREVRFGLESLADINSSFETLYLKNANGADLYIYPTFLLMQSRGDDFAIIGYDEIALYHESVRFIETDSVPSDSKVIDRTWAKVNKNGIPDKRFKGNYQIPIVQYGEIALSTKSGLNEEYQFSNYETSVAFAKDFHTYQQIMHSLSQLSIN